MPVPLSRYVEVSLTSEMYDRLLPWEQAMLPLLMDACREMDAIFWQEAAELAEDPELSLSAARPTCSAKATW